MCFHFFWESSCRSKSLIPANKIYLKHTRPAAEQRPRSEDGRRSCLKRKKDLLISPAMSSSRSSDTRQINASIFLRSVASRRRFSRLDVRRILTARTSKAAASVRELIFSEWFHAFFAFALIWCVLSDAARCTEFWVSSASQFSGDPRRPSVALDYASLFQPNAEWTTAARHLKVFKVDTAFVDHAPIELLKEAFATLQMRGLSLAWEMGAIPPGKDCGSGTEGYAGDTVRRISRIKEAGGVLKFVALDEPFWFGHFGKTKHTCNFTIAKLAAGVAAQLRYVYAECPTVDIGDIEPIGNPSGGDFIGELAEWFDTFKKVNGRPFTFFHADINWQGHWKEDLSAIQPLTKSRQIALGTIINGDPKAPTDIGWTDAAIKHLQDVVDIARFEPADIVIQTWDNRPTQVLPETAPGTLMNLVDEAARPPAIIRAGFENEQIRGQVLSPIGSGLRGATITVSTADRRGVRGFRVASLAGIVPPDATHAVFGIRMGVLCSCVEPVRVEVDKLVFTQPSGGSVTKYFPSSTNALRLFGNVGRFSINSTSFAVTPAIAYSAQANVRVQLLRDGFGTLAIIFLADNGAEVGRKEFGLIAPYQKQAEVSADENGKFSILYTGGAPAAAVDWRVDVAASSETRSTVLEIPAQ